jgi:hypothetical protein
MIMLHSNNQNYYGKRIFSPYFALFCVEIANTTPMNLIFKGSDLKELKKQWKKN